MKLDAIRADIIWENKTLAQTVLELQPADKPGVSLFLRKNDSTYA